jgi:outer membrane protein OmpA-like peptidoglycan-associated protein
LGVVGATLWIASGVAHAQASGNLDVDGFRPAIDSRGYITVNASEVMGHLDISFGLVTDWAHKALELVGPAFGGTPDYAADDATRYTVQNVITPTLQAAIGLVGIAEIAVTLPVHIVSGDVGPDFVGEATPNDDEKFNFSSQGLGDLGLHAKIRLLDTSRHPLGLGVIGSLYLPLGGGDNEWLGEGKLTPQVMGILDKETRHFRLAGNFGVRIRGAERVFVDGGVTGDDPAVPGTGQTVRAKTELPFGAAFAWKIVPERFDLIGEVTGSIATGAENYQPLEATLGVKVYLARNSFFLLGGGVGLLPSSQAAGNPDIRAFVGIVFEPNIGDRDGDDVKDDRDKCPDEAEDEDGFEDRDGCPDPDNDKDGILDEDDKCRDQPEDKDGVEDDDGCPEADENDRDGDGIPDNTDKCPDDPEDIDGFEDTDGCPEADNDKDGILDQEDNCPDEPEDPDKFEDEDGCPDPDNDNDRILDQNDQCPLEPETYNGNEDEDGCPDRGRVIVHKGNIEILDKIYFETGKATIKPESFGILDAIAATMLGNPDIMLIEIQGHADERGQDDFNLQLTDDRAHAVLKYLTEKGVEAARLTAKGYGETKPIEKGHNEAAWSKNRRVEFVILRRAGQP